MQFSYDLPNPTVTTDAVPVSFPEAGSTVYVDEPVYGDDPNLATFLPADYVCDQTFTYKLTGEIDETTNPAELTINPDTGIFTLDNIHSNNGRLPGDVYNVDITITTTDSVNPTFQFLSGV
jgi:hypothetical protein